MAAGLCRLDHLRTEERGAAQDEDLELGSRAGAGLVAERRAGEARCADGKRCASGDGGVQEVPTSEVWHGVGAAQGGDARLERSVLGSPRP
jgi:hypothetical protein